MRLPGDARRVTFRDDYKEKWDMMTKQMKKRELDKFFFSKVECTGIPQYGYASRLMEEDKNLSPRNHVFSAVSSAAAL